MSNFKRLFVAGLVGIALCIGVVGLAKLAVYRSRKDAEALVSEIRDLRRGASTPEDINLIARRHGSYIVTILPGDRHRCETSDEACNVDFVYKNTEMSRLRLAPVAQFSVRVWVDHGSVGLIMTSISAGLMPDYISATIEDGVPDDLIAPDSFHVSVASNWRGTAVVYMTRDVPRLQRDRAYTLGLSCLDKIGGCHSKSELLPELTDPAVVR